MKFFLKKDMIVDSLIKEITVKIFIKFVNLMKLKSISINNKNMNQSHK
jgi:hypothetical protein